MTSRNASGVAMCVCPGKHTCLMVGLSRSQIQPPSLSLLFFLSFLDVVKEDIWSTLIFVGSSYMFLLFKVLHDVWIWGKSSETINSVETEFVWAAFMWDIHLVFSSPWGTLRSWTLKQGHCCPWSGDGSCKSALRLSFDLSRHWGILDFALRISTLCFAE